MVRVKAVLPCIGLPTQIKSPEPTPFLISVSFLYTDMKAGLRRILQLILQSTTVTARARNAPGHDRSMGNNGSKRTVGSLDLLYIVQLSLHSVDIATPVGITPKSRHFHRQEWQQKLWKRLGSAVHSSAYPLQH